MIKFNKLKEFTKGIVTPKRIIDGNEDLSISEILSGKYFPCFKWNNNPSLVIDGLYVDNGIISMKWQELESVEIIPSEEYYKPIGGSIELRAEAKYRIYSCVLNGIKKIEEEYYKPINVVFHLSDNPLFTLNKNILTIGKNNGDEERNVNVSISYRQGKIVKENTIKITQLPNTISDWILTDITPIKLVLHSNIDTLSKDGGVVDLKVLKHSLKSYHKEDANGCILKDKHEEIIVENVTSLCTFKIFNGDYIKMVGSHAIVPQQKEESSPRAFEIMANLAHLTASKTFSQEGGGVAHYDYELAYMCTNKDSYVLELPTSVTCDGYQPIKFTKNKYIDGVLCGKIGMQAKDLKFQYIDKDFNITYKDVYETNWCRVRIEKHDFDSDDKLQIFFEIFENALKDSPRVADDIIICGYDKKLHLTIIQPPLKLVRQEPILEIKGETQYDSKTISNAYLEFIPSMKTIYEDDSEEVVNGIDDEYEIRYSLDNVDNIIHKKFWKSDFNGTHTLIFDIKDKAIDTAFAIKGSIFSKDKKFICSSDKLNIEYKNRIHTETYVFQTETQEYTWKNDWLDKIFIPINSKVTINDDGQISEEYVGYYMICTNDNHFAIEQKENGLYIQPKSINKESIDISETLRIKQNNSDKSFDIILNQEHYIEEDIIVNVKVIVAKDEITEEIWSSESTLYINDNNGQTLYTLFLSPCWLYPNMNENEDIIYQGNVILKENQEYQFVTTRFNLKKPISSIDYNINEKISFTKDENEMTIFIDL